MRASLRFPAWLALAAASAILGGCGNPAVDARVELLGEEVAGVEPSAYHRPGQPCVLCHSQYGGAEPEMSIGGTVYATRDDTIPANNVAVVLVDAAGTSPNVAVKTNCAGNFFVTKDQWDPTYPVYAEIQFRLPDAESDKRAAMGTWIQRDGSCSTCHLGDRNQGSAGRIFCQPTMPDPPFEAPTAETCPEAFP